MRKFVFLVCITITILCIMEMTASAEEIPTAKIAATLVGDSEPVAGEKFTVAINITDISSELFVSGEVRLEWSEDAVSLVDYYEDEPVIVTDDYCIGNIYNEYAGRTGKFTYITNFDRSQRGEAAAAIYIPLSARSQTAEAVSAFTMFEMSFMLNEGYTYDDFYLSITGATAFLTADKQTASCGRDGNITVEGIGEANVTASLNNTDMQPSLLTMVNAQNSQMSTGNDSDNIASNINIMYNGKYYEAVLNRGNRLDVELTIQNTSDLDKDFVCYIAEYNSDNSLLGFTKNNKIEVLTGSVVKQTISHTFTTSNAVLAKIFLWDKENMKPCTEAVTLSTSATDFYADTYMTAQCCDMSQPIKGEINYALDIDYIKFIPTVSGKYVFHTSSTSNVSGSLHNAQNDLVVSGTLLNGGYYCDAELICGNTYYLKTTGSTIGEYDIVITKMEDEGFVEITNDSIKFMQNYDGSLQTDINLYSSGTLVESLTAIRSSNKITAEFDVSNLQSNYTIAVIESGVIIAIYDIQIVVDTNTYNVTKKSYVSVPITVSNVSDLSDIYFSVAFNVNEFTVFDPCEYTHTLSETGIGLVSGAEINIEAITNNAVIFTSTKTLTKSWSGNVNTVKLQATENGEYTVKTVAYSVG